MQNPGKELQQSDTLQFQQIVKVAVAPAEVPWECEDLDMDTLSHQTNCILSKKVKY